MRYVVIGYILTYGTLIARLPARYPEPLSEPGDVAHEVHVPPVTAQHPGPRPMAP